MVAGFLEGGSHLLYGVDGLTVHFLDHVAFLDADLGGGAVGVDGLHDEPLRAAA